MNAETSKTLLVKLKPDLLGKYPMRQLGCSDLPCKMISGQKAILTSSLIFIGPLLNAKFFIHPIDFAGMQRIEKDVYPVAAVREMILNSQVHRTCIGAPTQIRLYDDDFSIWNDGGLSEGITEEDLKRVHRSKPRNPLIADVCFKAGYIDFWGRGFVCQKCFSKERREERYLL